MATVATNNVSTFTTKDQVLVALAAGQCTVDAASAWLKAHESNGNGKAGFYVKANPDKGTVSLYGLNRMPFTLYAKQWRTLLGNCDGPAGLVVIAFLDKYVDYLPTDKGQPATLKVPANLIGDGKPFRHPKDVE